MANKKFGTLLFSSSELQTDFNKLFVNNSHISSSSNLLKVPDTFDGRIIWRDYLNPIPNQNNCESCWVFVSLFVLSARLAIYTNGKYKYIFSPSKMIFNSKTTWEQINNQLNSGVSIDFTTPNKKIVVNKCSKGSLLEAWQFLYSIGVPETSCVQDESKLQNIYSSNQLFGDSYDVCPANHNEMVSHRAGGYYYVSGTVSKNRNIKQGSEKDIRRDIFHWGPCSSAMKIFKDFLTWDGEGIYVWDQISELADDVGHAVVLMGWGVEKDIPYWLVMNTWGDYWGENGGYFKILRGRNHCEIEENVIVGFPTLPAFTLFVEQPILFNPDDLAIRGIWGIQDNGYKLTSYEKVILDKEHKVDSSLIDYIYDPDFWPDFSKLVAGELSSRVYNIREGKIVKEKYVDPDTAKDGDYLDIAIIFLFVLIIVKILFSEE
jgi:cathepsin B